MNFYSKKAKILSSGCACVWGLSLYVTPTKASVNANMAGFRPYTWASCEERKGNVG